MLVFWTKFVQFRAHLPTKLDHKPDLWHHPFSQMPYYVAKIHNSTYFESIPRAWPTSKRLGLISIILCSHQLRVYDFLQFCLYLSSCFLSLFLFCIRYSSFSCICFLGFHKKKKKRMSILSKLCMYSSHNFFFFFCLWFYF